MDRNKFIEAVKRALASCFEAPDGSKNSLADCRAKPFDRWHANKPIVMDQNDTYLQRQKYLVVSMRCVPETDERRWHGFLAENGRGFVREVELEFRAPVWTAPVFRSRNLSDLPDEDLWVIADDLSELMGDYAASRLAEGTKAQNDGKEFHKALMRALNP